MIKYISALQKLVPAKICRYLQIHGWRELCTLFGGTAKQFVSDDDTQVVLIPFDSSYSDYLTLLNRAISDIAEYNNISVLTLLSELLNPSADILKWRIIDRQTELGQIPFDSMISYIGSIKNSLAAALLDTINPKVFHPKLLTKNVTEELSNCSFGQTEFGSYIINVICPLGEYQYNLFDNGFEDLPLYRKVNLKMMESLSVINRSVADGSNELDDAVGGGNVSVNFLDTIANIISVNELAHFDIDIVRSKSVPSPNDAVTNIQVSHVVNQKIIDVADRYRPHEQQNVMKTIFGKIINMSGDANPEDRDVFTITLLTLGDDNDKQHIIVRLNYAESYHVVSQAFENGLVVRVTGTYSSASRKKYIDNGTISIPN